MQMQYANESRTSIKRTMDDGSVVFVPVDPDNMDYAEIVDESDFSIATDTTHSKRAIIAGWLNGVRLIDNMQMSIGASV